ncbi:MAG: ASKHA domain-containing protein [Oscillospiraceae bacterium]|nr:ASKHA domain-containing protein [Oscillospiraceae bacterium]
MFGLAVDIGTTTVSALLVDLHTTGVCAKATAYNAQIRYGADVIFRIINQQKSDGINRLQKAIVKDTLEPLIDGLCVSAGISRNQIIKLTVAANTTMNHFLLGIDANSIRLAPYEPKFLEFPVFMSADIGITLAHGAKMILAPNIGSYVGGDITAGVLAAATPSKQKIWDRPEMSLLVDLGTNGEIVFGNNEFLMACACSAGPAFEGGDISCGMRASDGAIEACNIDNDTLEPNLKLIGGTKPAGICGSGLIDIIAELFRIGAINGKGKFHEKEVPADKSNPTAVKRVQFDSYGTGRYILVYAKDSSTGSDISITETDIDNFIRAKAAIFSGIMSLLTPLGFTPTNIDDVLIAGGIGSGINIRNAIRIGMLPDLPRKKYSYIGNSSQDGAYQMLISDEAESKVTNIAQNMTYIDLSTEPNYMNEFIAACFLPHTDETLFPSE